MGWIQPKQAARETPPATQTAPPANDATSPPPVLPPLEKLTIDSDFSGFFHPQVDEGLRRAALKKLFSDPHFNVMDGLDVYVDDYSQPNPLPAGMLAGLRQAQNILAWARETKEETAARFAAPPATAVTPPPGEAALPALATEPSPAATETAEVMAPATEPAASERKS